MDNDKGAFERDMTYRFLFEAARYWVIENYLRTAKLPEETTWFAYPNGEVSFDWGNPLKSTNSFDHPLRSKRVRITLTIEDWP